MVAMSGEFNAQQYAPKQLGESHPVGRFPFSITKTEIKENKSKDGGFLEVEFTTPVGTTVFRYNLWNPSEKAKEIAYGQLSALCHATGIFSLKWQTEGAELRGARGMIDVGYQKGEEPSQEKPNGGYTEIKKVYDAQGNEPGKAPAAAPAPQQQGWSPAPGAQTQPAQPSQQSGWNTAPSNPAPNSAAPAPQGWQQGGQTADAPPWRK